MNYELTGRLVQIYPEQAITERFKKREFVVETITEYNGSSYYNYAKMQAVNKAIDKLNPCRVGDTVKVHFSIKGSKYEKNGKENYNTSLDVWKVEVLASAATFTNNTQTQGDMSEGVDDLPF